VIEHVDHARNENQQNIGHDLVIAGLQPVGKLGLLAQDVPTGIVHEIVAVIGLIQPHGINTATNL